MSLQACGNLQEIIEEINRQTMTFDLRSVFPSLALAAYEGEDDEEDPEEEEETEEEDEDEGSEGDKSKKKEDKGVKDPEAKARSEEAKRYRLQAREAQKKVKELEDEKRERENAEKPELDRLRSEHEELQKRFDKVTPLLETQAIKLAFYESGAAALFQKPATALRLLDLSDIEVEDGEVDNDAIQELAEKLLKEEPYLAASGGKGDEDDEDDERKGQPSGRQTNGAKKKKGSTDFEALASKFPALRR